MLTKDYLTKKEKIRQTRCKVYLVIISRNYHFEKIEYIKELFPMGKNYTILSKLQSFLILKVW